MSIQLVCVLLGDYMGILTCMQLHLFRKAQVLYVENEDVVEETSDTVINHHSGQQ